jgi:hypothetical protein
MIIPKKFTNQKDRVMTDKNNNTTAPSNGKNLYCAHEYVEFLYS